MTIYINNLDLKVKECKGSSFDELNEKLETLDAKITECCENSGGVAVSSDEYNRTELRPNGIFTPSVATGLMNEKQGYAKEAEIEVLGYSEDDSVRVSGFKVHRSTPIINNGAVSFNVATYDGTKGPVGDAESKLINISLRVSSSSKGVMTFNTNVNTSNVSEEILNAKIKDPRFISTTLVSNNLQTSLKEEIDAVKGKTFNLKNGVPDILKYIYSVPSDDPYYRTFYVYFSVSEELTLP